jgi:flagellar protein FliS
VSWKTAYLETRILSAAPLELVSILYEYAIVRVQDARAAVAEGNVAARSAAISKALAIIGQLDGTLDHKAGGEVASNLAHLYRYMRERLTAANLNKSDSMLAEVEELLRTLGEAWKAIADSEFRSVESANPAWLPPAMETAGASMQEWTF